MGESCVADMLGGLQRQPLETMLLTTSKLGVKQHLFVFAQNSGPAVGHLMVGLERLMLALLCKAARMLTALLAGDSKMCLALLQKHLQSSKRIIHVSDRSSFCWRRGLGFLDSKSVLRANQFCYSLKPNQPESAADGAYLGNRVAT